MESLDINSLISDLALILVLGAVATVLFRMLKQPVVLGYIVAGFLASPHFELLPSIAIESNIEFWAQIGIIVLLFSLGLEFSFKKLIDVGGSAIVTALIIVLGMMSLGFIVGRFLGLGLVNSIFLGGMISMSSTTIILKALTDLNMRQRRFVPMTFAVLIVEDLFAVVLMVLLSSIAVEKQFAGTQLLMELGKLIAYLVLWFVVGIAIIPTFLKKFRKHLNDETLTIFAIGLCLGMVLLAIGAGFSSALGAFVMGSVLAETIEAERIEHLVLPIKNVFGSIFFVSVGMMINPELLLQYWLPIVIITLTVIIGQIIFASLGTLLSGQSLKVSLQTGFTLVQIGEFAFIIADFGQTAGVTESSLYPIVVAVSVITTFLTPYIMKASVPCYNFLYKHASERFKAKLDAREAAVAAAEQASRAEENGPSVADKVQHAVRKTFITKRVVNLFIKNMSENDKKE